MGAVDGDAVVQLLLSRRCERREQEGVPLILGGVFALDCPSYPWPSGDLLHSHVPGSGNTDIGAADAIDDPVKDGKPGAIAGDRYLRDYCPIGYVPACRDVTPRRGDIYCEHHQVPNTLGRIVGP